jgi:hypothetical protein
MAQPEQSRQFIRPARMAEQAKRRSEMNSEDVAFARLAAIGPSPAEKARLAEINRGIDQTMREVIADRKYDPYELDKRPDGSHRPPELVTPVGAPVVKDLPSGPTVSEPWRPMHKTQDWLRLGSTVASANVESAEKALREAGEEPEA